MNTKASISGKGVGNKKSEKDFRPGRNISIFFETLSTSV